jgi:hypothetical protein
LEVSKVLTTNLVHMVGWVNGRVNEWGLREYQFKDESHLGLDEVYFGLPCILDDGGGEIRSILGICMDMFHGYHARKKNIV